MPEPSISPAVVIPRWVQLVGLPLLLLLIWVVAGAVRHVVFIFLVALLIALLEPPAIKTAEANADFTSRLALQEEAKTMPFGVVWDYYCEQKGVPAGPAWLSEMKQYEKAVLSKRS